MKPLRIILLTAALALTAVAAPAQKYAMKVQKADGTTSTTPTDAVSRVVIGQATAPLAAKKRAKNAKPTKAPVKVRQARKKFAAAVNERKKAAPSPKEVDERSVNK